ncbi:hypothetical protein L7F22_050865 [Adiantum nelumboides]|nr:hypothetical protein [Adiantum nelumboides]
MAFPNFFGKQYESASNFLDDLEMAFLVSRRDEEEVKLRAFPLVLKDSAKNWFQNLEPGRKTNWETLKETFLSKYGGLDNPEHLWHRISSLHQATSRTYLTYESQFLRLWAEWEASLAEGERAPNFLKKEKFLAGLFPDLQEKVKGKFPETFEEAFQIARVKDQKLEYQAHTSRVEHPQGPTMADERLPPAPTTTPEDPHLELLQRVRFTADGLYGEEYKKNGKLIAQGKKVGKMFTLDVNIPEVNAIIFAHGSGVVADIEILHKRIEHANVQRLKTMQSQELVTGLPVFKVVDMQKVCEACQFGKQAKASFPHDKHVSRNVLELVHLDVWGPAKTASMGGCRFYVTFIDDHTRKVWVYFMKEKSEVFTHFQSFKAMAEKQTEKYVQCLRSDGGGEYFSNEFSSFLKKHGIQRQFTCSLYAIVSEISPFELTPIVDKEITGRRFNTVKQIIL